jgi:tyrosyl-tRNA synthetase
MTDEVKPCLSQFFKAMEELRSAKMTVVDKCIMASELDPSQWSEELLWPDGKTMCSIFGYRQVAMDREKTISLIDALEWIGLCSSKGDARKAIRNNGVRVNRKVVTDINRILTKTDALPNLDAIVLEFGKYNFGIIELC